MVIDFKATERHLPYGIASGYLPPDKGNTSHFNPDHADHY